jgi:dihydroflavonol-4-reductase
MHVVTGATGHIGVNLVRALALSGAPVRALSRTPPPKGLFDGLNVEFSHMDLHQPESIAPALAGADVVYHLAGLISITGDQSGLVHTVNVTGTEHVARAAMAAGCRRMVHVSSLQAFDVFAPGTEVTEDTPRPGPSAPAYDRSKADSETVIRTCIDDGLDAVIVNPTGVFGPLDHRPSRLGKALIDIRDGRVPALVSGHINVVDVRDVTAAILAAARRGRCGENYLLAGHDLSVPNLMRAAAAICGVESPGFVCPMWLARMTAPLATGWARLRNQEPLYTAEALRAVSKKPPISHAKATAELSHEPRPIDETLRELYSSFKALGL